MATTDTKELTQAELRRLPELTDAQRSRLEDLLTEQYGVEVRVVRVLGAWMPVTKPHQGQLAVLARLRTSARAAEAASDDAKRTDILVRATASIGTTLQSLFADPDDHEVLEAGIVTREIEWEAALDLFMTIFKVWDDSATEVPNRAEKRRARRTD